MPTNELDRALALLGALRRKAAFLHLPGVRVGDSLLATLDLLGVDLEHLDGDARVGEHHRDPGAHGTGADDRRRRDLLGTDVPREPRDLAELALREKDVDRRLRRIAAHELVEEPRFARDAEPVLELRCGLDGVDQRMRGEPAAILRRHHAVGHRDHRGRHEEFQVTDALLRPGVRTRELDGAREQITLDDLVDDPHALGRFCRFALAFEHHVERHLHARQTTVHRVLRREQARQPLRTAGTLAREPVVAGERHFQAATKRVPIQRRDVRLLRSFERCHDVARRLCVGRWLAEEPLDVEAAAERTVRSSQHDGKDAIVGLGRLDLAQQRGRQGK